jgi:hypothetical protein
MNDDKNSDKGEPADNGNAEGSVHEGRARMAPLAGSPPGLEQDGRGNVIPLPQRTKDDQEKAQGKSKG